MNILRSEVRAASNQEDYLAGRKQYEDGQVADVSEKEEYDNSLPVVVYEAFVSGEFGRRYISQVQADNLSGEIKGYHCSCMVTLGRKSMCSHCVALALKVIETKQQAVHLLQSVRSGTGHRYGGTVILGGRVKQNTATVRHTDAFMKDVLQLYGMKEKLTYLQDNTCYGKVELQPCLKLQFGILTIEFRVGISHKYIVKDVFEFADAFENNTQLVFGRNLTFYAEEGVFTRESGPILDFLRRFVKDIRTRKDGSAGYLTYNNSDRKRQIQIKGENLEELMALMQNSSVLMSTNQSEPQEWRIQYEKPPFELEICKADDGIEVKASNYPVIETKNYHIFLKDTCFYMVNNRELSKVFAFLDCLQKMPEGKSYIEKDDLTMFARDLLPSLTHFYRIAYHDFDPSVYLPETAEFEIYLDMPQKNMISCRMDAIYREKTYSVFAGQLPEQKRDMKRELEYSGVVREYFNAFDNSTDEMILSNDDELMYSLLTDGIDRLEKFAKVFLSDRLKRITIRENPRITMGISLSDGSLLLDMESEDMSSEELAEILSKYDRKKRFFRFKNGTFIDMPEHSMDCILDVCENIDFSGQMIKDGKIVLPKYRALYLDASLREQNSMQYERDGCFRELVRNMRNIGDVEQELPESLKKVLRGYQRKGFEWMKTLAMNGFGGILADDMGLGKTLQVLSFILSQKEQGRLNKPALIVCPASLVYNWNSEIQRFTPELKSVMVVGNATEREDILRRIPKDAVAITSYDLLKRDTEFYEALSFSCQVIDEAQFIKNAGTQTAKAVKTVHSDFKLALTGTPVENRMSELWSIFDYLMPGFLYQYPHFRQIFEMPVMNEGSEEAMKRLKKMIAPFVLRRVKKEVLKDLPDKLEEPVFASMEGEQEKLYRAHVLRLKKTLNGQTNEEFAHNRIQILAELTKLRQICCNPSLLYDNYEGNCAKQDTCMDLVKTAVEGGHKLLLFSQFTSMLGLIEGKLTGEGIAYYKLTGATSKEERIDLVERFNHPDTKVCVFLISLRAGGTGLNLTAADIVIHYDPWWNVAVQNQATDRAHRIGQKNVVTVYKLIMKNTIEEQIMNLQEKKSRLAEQILDGEEIKSASFSREELLEILGV